MTRIFVRLSASCAEVLGFVDPMLFGASAALRAQKCSDSSIRCFSAPRRRFVRKSARIRRSGAFRRLGGASCAKVLGLVDWVLFGASAALRAQKCSDSSIRCFLVAESRRRLNDALKRTKIRVIYILILNTDAVPRHCFRECFDVFSKPK